MWVYPVKFSEMKKRHGFDTAKKRDETSLPCPFFIFSKNICQRFASTFDVFVMFFVRLSSRSEDFFDVRFPLLYTTS